MAGHSQFKNIMYRKGAQDAKKAMVFAKLARDITLAAKTGMPDPDIIIRPSGEQRISNFLLWQAAYSEFVYLNILWPDFEPKHLDEAIEEFAKRNRRFGGV